MIQTKMNSRCYISGEYWKRAFLVTLCLQLVVSFQISHAAEPVADEQRLPRLKPTEIDQVMDTFEVKEGFDLELVAAEPMVVDPVAMDFDALGRAFVVEMIGYSERRPERLGRVRMLVDEDQDGTFDRSEIFARDLPWPTAVVCYDGGVFVGATPDIFYFKDSDGDGIADIRQHVFTGFADRSAPYRVDQLNMQAMMNSFHWGPDNRIHGATGLAGGNVYSPLKPDMKPVSLRGRDFSFDPRTLDIRAESGGAQNGMSFSADGEKFVCSNSDHIQHIVYDQAYASINPLIPAPQPRISIAEDGPAAPVFRISPDEPWRVIRTKWRVAGAVRGPIEGGGTPSGYFTGATGATIYTGDAWGEDFFGDAIIADCGSNLVHRKKLLRQGYTWTARRPQSEQGIEFVRSSDNWFRPVQFANGPDGNLYILDMYREVIEHPWSLPGGIKQFLDLNSGNDRGRIYRMKKTGKDLPSRPLPGTLEDREWIALLGHPNTWHRVTATRLLFEQGNTSIVPLIREVLDQSDNPDARMDAYQVLDGLGLLNASDVENGLKDPSNKVRLAMLRRLGLMDASPVGQEVLFERMPGLLLDHSTRFQAVLTLAKHPLPPEKQASLLWQAMVMETKDKNWMQFAVLNAMGNCLPHFAENLLSTPDDGTSLFADAREIYHMIGLSGDKQLIGDAFERLTRSNTSPDALTFLAVMGNGLRKARLPWDKAVDPDRIQHARENYLEWLKNDGSTNQERAEQVIRWLAQVMSPDIKDQFWQWLNQKTWLRLHPALISVLRPVLGDEDLQHFWPAWSGWTTQTRQIATTHLVSKNAWLETFLNTAKEKPFLLGDLTFAQRRRVVSHPRGSIRRLAAELLGVIEPSDRDLREKYQPALLLEANLENGHRLFMERCATCHRANGEGFEVGPDLVSVKVAGKNRILDSILFPNNEAQPQFMSYKINTKDGEEYEGLIENETASSISLRQSGGGIQPIRRDNIESFQGTGRSMMPEGLAEGMDVQDMADLLEYMVRLQR